jgi:hypothetical protein
VFNANMRSLEPVIGFCRFWPDLHVSGSQMLCNLAYRFLVLLVLDPVDAFVDSKRTPEA